MWVLVELCKRHGHGFYFEVQFDSNNIINNNNKKCTIYDIYRWKNKNKVSV